MDIKSYLILNVLSMLVIFLIMKNNYKSIIENIKYAEIKIIGYLMLIGYGMKYIILCDKENCFIRFLLLSAIVIFIMCKSKSKEVFLIALKSIKTYVTVEAFIISLYVSCKFVSQVKTLTFTEYIYIVIATMILYYIIESIYYQYIFLELVESKVDILGESIFISSVKIFVDIATLVASYVIVFFVYCYNDFIYANNLSNLINIIVLLALTMIIIEMYLGHLINQYYKNSELKVRAINLENQLEYQLKHYEQFYKFQEKNRKIMHDNKQHMELIYNLIKEEEYDLAIDYIDKVNVIYKRNKKKEFTKNKIIDAILNSKLDQCSKEKIKVDIHIKIPENLDIDKVDLCIIIGNLFDNSIEAAKKVKEESKRSISIYSKVVKNKFIFKIINTYNGEIDVQANKILTSKEHKAEHGIGLSNIKDTVKKYNGTFNYSYDKESFQATVYIGVIK